MPTPAIIPPPVSNPTSVTVNVTTSTPAGAMPAGAVGFSFEKNTVPTGLFSSSNTPLVNLFKLLGPGVLRVGGDSVDHVAFDPTGKGGAWNVVAPSDLTNLADFVTAAGWSVLYGTPFLFATAQSAAAEAQAAVTALGESLKSFELCNEPDLYPVNVMARSAAGTPASFNARWAAFAQAVQAAAPAVALTGPAYAFLTSFDIGASGFLEQNPAVSECTQHYYRGYGVIPASQTAAELLGGDVGLDLSLLKIPSLTGAKPPIAFRLSETNSFASGGQPGVSDTFAAALWAADLALRLGASGAAGVNFHNSGECYPAILIQNGAVSAVCPLFYGMLFASQAGTGPMVSAAPNTLFSALRSYAIQTAPDNLCVALINRGSTDLNVSLEVGSSAVNPMEAMWLLAPSLDATSGVTLGGESVDAAGDWGGTWWDAPPPSGGNPNPLPLPAYSAALVSVTLSS